jgi:ABC-2 type transport system permease protein
VFRRVVAEIRRDHASVALLLVAPLVLTGLVTFILREAEKPAVNAVVVNGAGLPGVRATAALEAAIGASGTVRILPDRAAVDRAIEEGTANVGVVLPAGLGSSVDAVVAIVTRGLDPGAESGHVMAAQRALAAAMASLSGRAQPTVVHVTVHGVPSDDPILPFAPAMLAFFAYFFVYLLTGVSFLRERAGGTLERLMATPVSRGDVVAGYSLGFGLFAMVQVALLMVWVLGTVRIPGFGPLPEVAIGLGVPAQGSALLAFLIVGLLSLGAVSLGIFLSTFARTELQVIQFIPVVIVPQFLLSGVLFPTSQLPAILQPLVVFMPLHYAVDGLRQVFLRGAGLTTTDLALDIVALAVVAILFAAAAARTIRREVV